MEEVLLTRRAAPAAADTAEAEASAAAADAVEGDVTRWLLFCRGGNEGGGAVPAELVAGAGAPAPAEACVAEEGNVGMGADRDMVGKSIRPSGLVSEAFSFQMVSTTCMHASFCSDQLKPILNICILMSIAVNYHKGAIICPNAAMGTVGVCALTCPKVST